MVQQQILSFNICCDQVLNKIDCISSQICYQAIIIRIKFSGRKDGGSGTTIFLIKEWFHRLNCHVSERECTNIIFIDCFQKNIEINDTIFPNIGMERIQKITKYNKCAKLTIKF